MPRTSWTAPKTHFPELWVWPDRVLLAVFDPVFAEEVRFGIDLRQVQGQQRLDALCGFLRTIGQLLDRPVVMARDGDPDTNPADLAYRPEVDRRHDPASPDHKCRLTTVRPEGAVPPFDCGRDSSPGFDRDVASGRGAGGTGRDGRDQCAREVSGHPVRAAPVPSPTRPVRTA